MTEYRDDAVSCCTARVAVLHKHRRGPPVQGRPLPAAAWPQFCGRGRPAESQRPRLRGNSSMKCNFCPKPATLHITDLHKGVVKTIHLCNSCAQKHIADLTADVETDPAQPNEATAVSMLQLHLAEVTEESEEQEQQRCPICGITYQEFRKRGRLGCPNDYTLFAEPLTPLLENIHGSTQHTGKIPRRTPAESRKKYELIRLRNELRQAIRDENYEEAAKLRDQIRTLEQQQASE
ncbi:MAG: hypothetical protein D6725_11015 [Planctomycetota bacterium]|nr:MAG: hypothetical protein D6725_11015 [Planctomycetota bacterium]